MGLGGEEEADLGGEEEADLGGEEEIEQTPEDKAFADELAALEEADIEVDIEDQPEDKKLDVEDDEGPSDEEKFGKGLEGLDETGRNMAYTSFRKVSQYILDAYDSLANMEDKEVFVDYLITNLKLYFDKFEDELQSAIPEPTTPEYEDEKDELDASTEPGDEEMGEEGGEGGEGLDDLTLQEGFGLSKQLMVNLGLDFEMVKRGFFDQIQSVAYHCRHFHHSRYQWNHRPLPHPPSPPHPGRHILRRQPTHRHRHRRSPRNHRSCSRWRRNNQIPVHWG